MTEAPRTALITGGSGCLGINLIRYLLARGFSIRSQDIAPFPYEELRGRIEIIPGDVRDRKAVAAAVAGADLVVHAAAALPLQKERDIWTTQVDGTGVVLGECLASGVRRFVFISSTAVYGIPTHHPVVEDDPLSGVGPYGSAKIAAEKICREYRDRGLCVAILRPKSFVGPERLGVFAMLFEWAAEGRSFPLIGSGQNRFQLLDVEDLCEAILRAATLPEERVNDVFNIGAARFETMRADYQAVLDAAGFHRRIVALPAGPAIALLRLFQRLRLSPLYRWIYETASRDSFVATEKAERMLGFVPRFSNQEALRRNYEWYLENRARFQGISGRSHTVPWAQGILAVAKHFF